MTMQQKNQEYTYPMRITSAQNEMLELLSEKTGRTKASLIREAINHLLGVYKPVLDSGVKDDPESER